MNFGVKFVISLPIEESNYTSIYQRNMPKLNICTEIQLYVRKLFLFLQAIAGDVMQLRYVLPVEMITGPYDSADEASIASVSMEIVAGPSSKDDNIIENGVNGDHHAANARADDGGENQHIENSIFFFVFIFESFPYFCDVKGNSFA